jgi:hypothetical protein
LRRRASSSAKRAAWRALSDPSAPTTIVATLLPSFATVFATVPDVATGTCPSRRVCLPGDWTHDEHRAMRAMGDPLADAAERVHAGETATADDQRVAS